MYIFLSSAVKALISEVTVLWLERHLRAVLRGTVYIDSEWSTVWWIIWFRKSIERILVMMNNLSAYRLKQKWMQAMRQEETLAPVSKSYTVKNFNHPYKPHVLHSLHGTEI